MSWREKFTPGFNVNSETRAVSNGPLNKAWFPAAAQQSEDRLWRAKLDI
jgi:hypothetical protein